MVSSLLLELMASFSVMLPTGCVLAFFLSFFLSFSIFIFVSLSSFSCPLFFFFFLLFFFFSYVGMLL